MTTLDDLLSGRATETMTFNERVWMLCAKIPAGRVSTYGKLAAALGRPGAARAVGNALNRNPHAPTIPCHRVVGGDGRLTGYAGGLDQKAAMLAAEGITIRNGRAAIGLPTKWHEKARSRNRPKRWRGCTQIMDTVQPS